MAKDIIIEHNGQEMQHSGVKNLKIPTGKGSMLWYPEDEVPVAEITINQNGEYTAESKGLYGFSVANVNITTTSSMTGHGTDGNEYNITKNDQDQIVKQKMPTVIEIDTPPTNLVYSQGAAIDFTGMVVRAYDESGAYWTEGGFTAGVIPDNQLSKPVVQADFGEGYSGGSDEIAPYNSPFAYMDGRKVTNWAYTYVANKDVKITSFRDPQTKNSMFVMASKTPATYDTYHGNFKSGSGTSFGTVTLHGETFYVYSVVNAPDDLSPVLNQQTLTSKVNKAAEVAYAMLYGTPTSGGTQVIPIRYTRPDGHELETSFNIIKR